MTSYERPEARGSVSVPHRLNRRKFLGGAAAGLGAFALGPAILTSRSAVAAAGSFSQSVASGDPATDAITLWTRVDGVTGDSTVRLEVFTDSGGGGGVFDGPVSVLGGNPIAKVRLDNLDAGEQYFYRFSTGSDVSDQGRFRTARPADSKEPVKIAFFSCQEFVSGYYHAHADLAEMDDIDLVICLGDYVYEKQFDSGGIPERMDPTGEVQTLAEYRSKYDFYHTDEDLLAMRAKHPMTAIWDDHEVEDNYAEMLPGGQTDDRRIPYRNRMANGYRAFFEYIPRFPVARDQTRIYRSIPLGNTEVFLLDERQYRDNQVCAPGDSFFAPGCPPSEHSKPDRTLLGKEQLAFLKDGLRTSPATWKVVATGVMIMSLDATPGNPLNTDGWDGYGDERRRLVQDIQASDNVTFVTGDIHTFFAGDVAPTGRALPAGAAGTDSRATEFVGGSISSKGIVDRTPGDERSRRPAAAVADANVRVGNPHIKFSNQNFKGYAVLESGRMPAMGASDQDLRVEYRAVCASRSPTHKDVEPLARFRVAKDSARVVVENDFSATACSSPSPTGAITPRALGETDGTPLPGNPPLPGSSSALGSP